MNAYFCATRLRSGMQPATLYELHMLTPPEVLGYAAFKYIVAACYSNWTVFACPLIIQFLHLFCPSHSIRKAILESTVKQSTPQRWVSFCQRWKTLGANVNHFIAFFNIHTAKEWQITNIKSIFRLWALCSCSDSLSSTVLTLLRKKKGYLE